MQYSIRVNALSTCTARWVPDSGCLTGSCGSFGKRLKSQTLSLNKQNRQRKTQKIAHREMINLLHIRFNLLSLREDWRLKPKSRLGCGKALSLRNRRGVRFLFERHRTQSLCILRFYVRCIRCRFITAPRFAFRTQTGLSHFIEQRAVTYA